jgi:hypothetical protein
VDTFEIFYENKYEQAPFTRENVDRGLGIELSETQWTHLSKFPTFFDDKVVVRQVHLDPRYKNSNEIFIRKVFALVAVCLGYGVTKGFKLPKTKIFIKRHRAGEQTPAGYHAHYRSRSWSHEIEIFLDHVIPSIKNLFNVIAHEMAHSLQTTTRRLHTPPVTDDAPYTIKWDKQWYKAKSGYEDPEGYKEQPWEKQAYEKSEEVVDYAIQYLQSGVMKGFNPKRV